MSRLIKKLNCVRQPEPQYMGFIPNDVSLEKSRMQIIAQVKAEILENIGDQLKSADGVLIESTAAADNKAAEKFCQSEDSIPAGRRIKDIGEKSLKKVLESPCDFVVFDATVPVSVTKNKKVGRILELDINLNEGILRTVSELPVDAAIISIDSEGSSLTIQNLMLIQRVANMVNKPILVSVSDEISVVELQSLWDIGICGLVFRISDQKSVGNLKDILDKIANLETPSFKKKSKMTAILPQSRTEKAAIEEDDGEEEEDE
jgi:hypothetical protein